MKAFVVTAQIGNCADHLYVESHDSLFMPSSQKRNGTIDDDLHHTHKFLKETTQRCQVVKANIVLLWISFGAFLVTVVFGSIFVDVARRTRKQQQMANRLESAHTKEDSIRVLGLEGES